jgi:hypothetical protein
LIKCEFDTSRRIVRLDLRQVTRADTAANWVVDLARREPLYCQWDWIVDLRGAFDDAGPQHMSRLAAAFLTPRRPVWSILISHDPYLYLWAQAMDAQFPNRRHVIASSPEEAGLKLRQARRTVDA